MGDVGPAAWPRVIESPVKRLVALITSTRLAIAILAYIALASIVATLVPPGWMFAAPGPSGFFASPAFIIPVFIFFANLSACTAQRLVRQIRMKHGRRFGPDILHVGLMVLVLGSLWSVATRQEGSVMLTIGARTKLPDGSVLQLDDFRFERYPDGRPRDWISVVSIEKDGVVRVEHHDIRVNAPLRYAGLTFYQAGYQTQPDGTMITGIRASADKGYPLVVVALVLISLGTSMTFIQKLRKEA